MNVQNPVTIIFLSLGLFLLAACAAPSATEEASDVAIPPILEELPIKIEQPEQTPDQAIAFMQKVNASQSRAGIEVMIAQVSYSPEETVVEVDIRVDSDWGLTGSQAVAPQQALLGYLRLLDAQGREIPGIRGEYREGIASSGGGMIFSGQYTFAGLPAGTQSLTLLSQGPILLTEFVSTMPLYVDVAGREVGDTWDLEQNLLIGGIPLYISQARLADTQSSLHQFRLEFETKSGSQEKDGIAYALTECVYMSNYSQLDQALAGGSCDYANGFIVPYVEFGPAKNPDYNLPNEPLEFWVRGTIEVPGPWEITWQVLRDG